MTSDAPLESPALAGGSPSEGGEGEIGTVLIVGCGFMGSGIAQVCAQAGLEVLIHDSDPSAVERALAGIERSAARLAEKGQIREPATTVLSRIRPAGELTGSSGVGLAIEAVFENLPLKQAIFRRLDEICGPEACLATNTSALSVTELAGVTGRPERVLGLHFFSPVPLTKAVEVVRGLSTSDETARLGAAFVRRIGKEPIRVERDVPGFVLNRLNLPSIVEAMRLVEEGVTTPEDIDKGVTLALGRKMGIFETGDMVGLDVTHAVLEAMYDQTRDPRWYPPTILRRKVAAGHLGRKAGRGWYEYDASGRRSDL